METDRKGFYSTFIALIQALNATKLLTKRIKMARSSNQNNVSIFQTKTFFIWPLYNDYKMCTSFGKLVISRLLS